MSEARAASSSGLVVAGGRVVSRSEGIIDGNFTRTVTLFLCAIGKLFSTVLVLRVI